jgi:hypothetical protein
MWNESDEITGSIPCLQIMLPWNKHLGRWISWTHTWKSHLNSLECVCGISVFKRSQVILIYGIKWGILVCDGLWGSIWKCHTYVVYSIEKPEHPLAINGVCIPSQKGCFYITIKHGGGCVRRVASTLEKYVHQMFWIPDQIRKVTLKLYVQYTSANCS